MLRWKMCLPGGRWACPTGLSPVKSLRSSASFQLYGLIKQEECVLHGSLVDHAHHLWVDDTVPGWGSSREPTYEIMQVWWGSRAEPLCDSRVVQVWWGSWAEPMCYQSRADSSAELLWSQSSAGSEEVPVENHDDCFSGKQWVWSSAAWSDTDFSYIFRWQWSSLTRSEDRWFRGSQKKPETRSHAECQMLKTTFLAKRECWLL